MIKSPNGKTTPILFRLLSLLAGALLLTTIGGCAQLSGTKPLAVNLPSDCDQATEPYPPVTKGEDLGVRTGKLAGALGQANTRIEAGNDCNAKVRNVYGSPK